MKKIGIIGGSFDPIHFGHLLLAEQVREEEALTQVVFMPAYVSPFKQDRKAAEAQQRLKMVEFAVESNPWFSVSDMEIRQQCISYTAETVRRFRKEAGEETELCFITGTDAFMGIEGWKEAEYLLRTVSFAIGLRPGFPEEDLDILMDGLKARYGTRVRKVYSPQVNISSSFIREQIMQGKSPRYLLPDRVLEYIEREGLYLVEQRDGSGARNPELKEKIWDYLEKNLKTKRLLHVKGVVSEAAALARRFGADPEKAELCALFHDACRDAGNLEHGPKAARMMEEEYQIRDEDMLNSVRYHTTGREGMSTLEKVLYLADAIEPSREYPGVEELRELSKYDLNGACLAAMERSIQYVRERGAKLDENTVKAREYLLKRREHE